MSNKPRALTCWICFHGDSAIIQAFPYVTIAESLFILLQLYYSFHSDLAI